MGSKVDKFFNKAADKLIPKELAPFLPVLGAFAPGLGGLMSGTLARYLVPQLLTAASSAKMTGEVDPKQQAITGIMSALQGPTEQTKAEKAFMEKNPELLKQVEKAEKLGQATTIDDIDRIKELAEAGLIEGQNPAQKFITGKGPTTSFDRITNLLPGGPLSDPVSFFTERDHMLNLPSYFEPGNMFGLDELAQFTDNAGDIRYFVPDSEAYKTFLNKEITSPINLEGLTGQKFKDAIVGSGNITDAGFDKKLEVLQGTKGIGKQHGLQALNKARSFFDSPIGFNMPTATKVGLGSMPYFAAEAANYKKQMEQEEEEAAAQQQSYADAMSQLGTYYSRLADPTRRFGEYEFAANGGLMGTRAGYNMGGIGSIPQTPMVPQGMQLDGRGGGFIPMGAQEKHDDVPAMLAKNEFVMTSDAVKAAGGGSIEKGAQKMYDLMNQLEAQV